MNLTVQSPNLVLSSLSSAEYELVQPQLRCVELPRGAVLKEAGRPITQVYFPYSGVISLAVMVDDGDSIEVGLVGRNGVVGAAAALGEIIAVNDAIVQIPGRAGCIDIHSLRAATERGGGLLNKLLRYERGLLVQAQQLAACNALHGVEQRLANRLLRMRDVSGSDALPLTQETAAGMLGVRRTTVSLVAHEFQQAGLIRYCRGTVELTNVQGLKARSCECYGMVRAHLERLSPIGPRTFDGYAASSREMLAQK